MSEHEETLSGLEPDAFEWQLTQALRRVDAPEGFAERVMERCAEGVVAATSRAPEAGSPPQRASALAGDLGPGAPRVSGTPKVVMMRPRFALVMRGWVGGAIAAALVLGVFGTEQVHVRHERERAALATQQFEAGVRVTDQALAQTRAQLARAGVNLGD